MDVGTDSYQKGQRGNLEGAFEGESPGPVEAVTGGAAVRRYVVVECAETPGYDVEIGDEVGCNIVAVRQLREAEACPKSVRCVEALGGERRNGLATGVHRIGRRDEADFGDRSNRETVGIAVMDPGCEDDRSVRATLQLRSFAGRKEGVDGRCRSGISCCGYSTPPGEN